MIKLFASAAVLIGSAYLASVFLRGIRAKDQDEQLADLRTTTQLPAAFVIPSWNPATAGFSNFSRRLDIVQPLDIADQPLAYGLSIPQ